MSSFLRATTNRDQRRTAIKKDAFVLYSLIGRTEHYVSSVNKTL